ncbi:MAG TPA: hydroxyacylglutathione hydrolase [Burkholderiales bacterium]|nr:hydroxyacylglutathione hydrolase [Burkholderiales bacterium]
MSKPTVVPIPAFNDNYIWALHDTRRVAIVDPGDARPVQDYLRREGLALSAILLTHHHNDHIGGVATLARAHDVPIYAPHDERIATATERVREGDTVELPEFGLKFEVLEVPGHTRTHVAYYGAGMLFCGDTLFACGCGRLFEGTPEQMHRSLGKFAALPDDTLVYCAHEYTLSNIAFSRAVEPDNAALAAREASDRASREANRPTLPSTIGLEKATNPFLRVTEPAVTASAARYAGRDLGTPVDVLAAIRQWKNEF